METWKPVLGFEDLYEVSDIGNVRRIARGKTLDSTKIAEAKEMLAAGATLKVVAKFLNTSIATAWNIKMERTWSGDASYRMMKPRLNRTFYMMIELCRDGKYAKKSVHRLVWEAFNGAIPGRLEVNHKNLDRADNRLENLELMTHQENVKHAFDIYRQDPNSRQPAGRPGSYRGKYFKHNQKLPL
jgi:hypothetical protein